MIDTIDDIVASYVDDLCHTQLDRRIDWTTRVAPAIFHHTAYHWSLSVIHDVEQVVHRVIIHATESRANIVDQRLDIVDEPQATLLDRLAVLAIPEARRRMNRPRTAPTKPSKRPTDLRTRVKLLRAVVSQAPAPTEKKLKIQPSDVKQSLTTMMDPVAWRLQCLAALAQSSSKPKKKWQHAASGARKASYCPVVVPPVEGCEDDPSMMKLTPANPKTARDAPAQSRIMAFHISDGELSRSRGTSSRQPKRKSSVPFYRPMSSVEVQQELAQPLMMMDETDVSNPQPKLELQSGVSLKGIHVRALDPGSTSGGPPSPLPAETITIPEKNKKKPRPATATVEAKGRRVLGHSQSIPSLRVRVLPPCRRRSGTPGMNRLDTEQSIEASGHWTLHHNRTGTSSSSSTSHHRKRPTSSSAKYLREFQTSRVGNIRVYDS